MGTVHSNKGLGEEKEGDRDMSDYINRQAAIILFQRIADDDWNQGAGTTWANAYAEAADLVEDLPSADVEPVVHCRDCIFGYKYFDVINGITDSWVECRNPDGLHRDVSCDGYCSAGIKYRGENGGL